MARADYTYTAIPQSGMSLVEVNSVSVNEGVNGAGELALDGNTDTFWHTEWQPDVVQPPHHITIKLADQAVQFGRVTLTPRQSSNGSGRANEYELQTANGDCTTATYTKVAEGAFSGLVADNAKDQVITLDTPVAATCAKVIYKSSWGGHVTGDTTSRAETVASLAEFNAESATGTAPTPTPTATQTAAPGPEIVIPDGAIELTDGDLKVRLHPDFPQVVDYRLGDKQLAGRLGDALTSVLINEVEQPVTVGDPVVADGSKSVTYPLTFPNLPGVSFDAVASLEDGAFTLTFTNIKDDGNAVNRLRIPNHDLVSVTSDDAASQLTAGNVNVNRASTADWFENVANTAAGSATMSYMVVANNSTLAAAFDSNGTEDNRATGTTSPGRV